jgi:hypothetical protein
MDDGEPMSDDTLNKGLRVMGRDTGPGGDHRARGFRSTASTLLEEGAFDGPTTRRKKGPTPRQGVRRQPGDGDKNKIRGIYNRAAYCAPNACV